MGRRGLSRRGGRLIMMPRRDRHSTSRRRTERALAARGRNRRSSPRFDGRLAAVLAVRGPGEPSSARGRLRRCGKGASRSFLIHRATRKRPPTRIARGNRHRPGDRRMFCPTARSPRSTGSAAGRGKRSLSSAIGGGVKRRPGTRSMPMSVIGHRHGQTDVAHRWGSGRHRADLSVDLRGVVNRGPRLSRPAPLYEPSARTSSWASLGYNTALVPVGAGVPLPGLRSSCCRPVFAAGAIWRCRRLGWPPPTRCACAGVTPVDGRGRTEPAAQRRGAALRNRLNRRRKEAMKHRGKSTERSGPAA